MMLLAGVGIIILVAGIIIGFVIGRRSSKLAVQLKAAEAELAQTQQQLSTYQNQVSNHFQKTADLFTDLTQHYHDVYKHLATGAQTLCQDSAIQDQLRLLKSNLVSESDDDIVATQEYTANTLNTRKEPYVCAERATVYPRDYATEN